MEMQAGCILMLVFVLASLRESQGKSTSSGKTIILQENVSKFMDIDIASSNIDTENTLSIRCNNITLYICRKDNVCTKKTKSNIFNITKTKDRILRVYFENVVRDSPIPINGTWQVCNAGENGNSCDDTLTRKVFIYAQLDYFNCTYDFADEDHSLQISCTVVNIFPQAICSFDTMKVLSKVEYKADKIQGITKCSVTLDINKDPFQVRTTIYPNITGDITDMAYGISVTLSVKNVKKIIPGKRKCFLEGNSTSIHSCNCEESLLASVALNSSVITDEIGFYTCPYLGKSTSSGKTIILQENISKFIYIDIASSNIDTENTIEIRCNNITLYMCRKYNVCNKKTKSNIFNVTKSKGGILRVYFENVIRNSSIVINGTWQVCNAGESGNTCDDTLIRHVFIYAQLDYFNCTYDFADEDHSLQISCTVVNIFPQAICSFDTMKIVSDIEYKHDKVQGIASYFNTKCSVTLDINKDSFQVKTTMYPNITGDITDMTYGISVTLSVMNVKKIIPGKRKCFLEGNSTLIYSCNCEESLLASVAFNSNVITDEIGFVVCPYLGNSTLTKCVTDVET
ncbi:polymorphic transmembrane cluster 2 transmembrane protein 2 [Biomphalaria glabrata]